MDTLCDCSLLVEVEHPLYCRAVSYVDGILPRIYLCVQSTHVCSLDKTTLFYRVRLQRLSDYGGFLVL